MCSLRQHPCHNCSMYSVCHIRFKVVRLSLPPSLPPAVATVCVFYCRNRGRDRSRERERVRERSRERERGKEREKEPGRRERERDRRKDGEESQVPFLMYTHLLHNQYFISGPHRTPLPSSSSIPSII